MKNKPGEITVFLSLITVCCMSLFLGLLESARTTGARLYMEMAANSSIHSVMSQYNRNLWDMYHLLFLECESQEAVKESFEGYLAYYMEQENLYPMKVTGTEIVSISYMTGSGGDFLENEIADYMKYRLPELTGTMENVAGMAKEASKAGEFQSLLDVCLSAGAKTRRLEKSRKRLMECITNMDENVHDARSSAEKEQKGKMETSLNNYLDEAGQFPKYLRSYAQDVKRISDYLEELKEEKKPAWGEKDIDAEAKMDQEMQAFIQIEAAAKEQLEQYKGIEAEMVSNSSDAEQILRILEGGEDGEETDWEMIRVLLDGMTTLTIEKAPPQKEQEMALDRLETLFSEGLLSLVLPNDIELSEKQVTLTGLPSQTIAKKSESSRSLQEAAWYHFIVNEYCLKHFDSFLLSKEVMEGCEKRPLYYEMEYLISGKSSDRENLSDTILDLVFVRAAMNFCYLVSSSEQKMEADGLAAALSGGSLPVQVILSFFILTLWSMGEAVLDVRRLLNGGNVPFWKTDGTWQMGLEQLLSLEFINWQPSDEDVTEGCGYEDYLRILCFLLDREIKNYRIMDLIQWNVQTRQPDFKAADCVGIVEMEARIKNRHLFFEKHEYEQTAVVRGSYEK